MMSFEEGKSEFLQLMNHFKSEDDSLKFLDWLKDEALEILMSKLQIHQAENRLECRRQLTEVAMFSRTLQPNFEGIFSTEKLQIPQNSEEGLNFDNTVHLDSFLYDEADVEELTEEGKIPTHFCKQCNSKNVCEIEMISHSAARDDLEYIFQGLLPDLSGKTVLDVGSRIGAVLFGSFIHSQAQNIIGIEMNTELCNTAMHTCLKFNMNSRIQVINAELSTKTEILRQTDVIILNNVFDWFAPIDIQVKLWQIVRQNVKPGALIVTIPSLQEALRILPDNANIDLDSWVQACPPFRSERISKDLLNDKVESIFLYSVKSRSED